MDDLNLPWEVRGIKGATCCFVANSKYQMIISFADRKTAAHIVRAVNNHDALVAALETVLANAPEPYCAITRAVDRQVREALAAARGEK